MRFFATLLLLLLSLGETGFCSSPIHSPRLLITLGTECDFTAEELAQEIQANLVSGTEEEIESAILANDKPGKTHLTVVSGPLEDLYWFTRKIGYGSLELNQPHDKALDHLKKKLSSFPLTSEALPKMDPKQARQLYDVMGKVDQILRKKNLSYWIAYGTLLGAVRHQGLIPWDDDLDIAIYKEDVPRLEALKEALSEMGLELYHFEKYGFYKIFAKDGDPILHDDGSAFPWNFPFVDIFPWELNDNGEVRDCLFKDRSLPKEDLTMPLEELPFGPLTLLAPHNAKETMARWFDADWNDVAYADYCHQTESPLEKIKVDLVDRSPADYEAKQILVVGGAGYIGSQVNKMLADAGYKTVVLDNLSRGNPEVVVRGELLVGDTGDAAFLDTLFENYSFDAVMHFAAFLDVGESVQKPEMYFDNNVRKTKNLLQAMLRHNVKKLIFSSTASIFGITDQKIDEEHPKQPMNPYGRTKLDVEQYLEELDKSEGLRFCTLRYFNAAGGDPAGEIKNFKTKEINLIPLALRSLQTGRQIKIFGTDYSTRDGTCIRDYIHIYDLGKAHIAALKRLLGGSPSCCYNLGNGDGFTVREILDSIERVTHLKLNQAEGERREGDPPILIANSDKAKRELGWTPYYRNIDTMVEHAWQALKK